MQDGNPCCISFITIFYPFTLLAESVYLCSFFLLLVYGSLLGLFSLSIASVFHIQPLCASSYNIDWCVSLCLSIAFINYFISLFVIKQLNITKACTTQWKSKTKGMHLLDRPWAITVYLQGFYHYRYKKNISLYFLSLCGSQY